MCSKTTTGKRVRRLISLTLLCSMLLSCTLFPGISVHADTLEDLEQQYNKIEDKMRENEEKMADVEEDKVSQKDAVDALQSEINGLNSQIDILDDKYPFSTVKSAR